MNDFVILAKGDEYTLAMLSKHDHQNTNHPEFIHGGFPLRAIADTETARFKDWLNKNCNPTETVLNSFDDLKLLEKSLFGEDKGVLVWIDTYKITHLNLLLYNVSQEVTIEFTL